MGNLLIINAHIFTPQGHAARRGAEMNELLEIPSGYIEITDGVITAVGQGTYEHKATYTLVDAEGKVVLPGFVDSHTHLVFGGYRPDEFIWRMNGDSYMSIMDRGGGIYRLVRASREVSLD